MARVPLNVSPHGIVLEYAEGDASYVDGEAGYVDDILDCFDSWDGSGQLKLYVEKQFNNELVIFDAHKSSPIAQADPDSFEAHRTLLTQKISLLAREPEDGLVNVRVQYLQNPKKTIKRMLEAARQRSVQRLIVVKTGSDLDGAV